MDQLDKKQKAQYPSFLENDEEHESEGLLQPDAECTLGGRTPNDLAIETLDRTELHARRAADLLVHVDARRRRARILGHRLIGG